MSRGCSFFYTSNFSSLLLADILSLCDFIYSQPHCFACLIFFFPHLLQLLLFLCPLLSTSLLIVLLSVSGVPTLETSNWRYGLFSFACQMILDILETGMDDESMFNLFEPFVLVASELEACFEFEALHNRVREDLIVATRSQYQCIGVDESKEQTNSSVESFGWETEELYKDRDMSIEFAASNKIRECDDQEIMSLGIKNRVSQSHTLSVGEEFAEFGSRIHTADTKEDSKDTEDTQKTCKDSDVMVLDLKENRSEKREKEWKRTLACKLYEERLSDQGVEKMDLLWEVYEADSGIGKEKNTEAKVKNGGLDRCHEEKEEMDEKLCCLEAIRFSTLKMNFGVRKPNLVKISKALKGVGMFLKMRGKF